MYYVDSKDKITILKISIASHYFARQTNTKRAVVRKFITTEERNKSSFPGHYSCDLDNKCGRNCTNSSQGQYDRLRLVNVQTAF